MIRRLGILCSALMLFTASGYAQSKGTISLATGDFPPLIAENMPNKGAISEIVTRSFKNAGYDVKVTFLPWKRAYRESREMRYDGTYSWSPKPERKKDFAFSDAIYYFERRVFVMKTSSIVANEAEDLTGLRLCRPIAYALHGKFEEMEANGDIVLVRPPDMVTCFRFMREGRVDFVEVSYEEGISSALKAMDTLDMIRTLEFVPARNMNALAIPLTHPKKDELLADFNKGLKQLHENGDYEEIKERHHRHFLDTLTK